MIKKKMMVMVGMMMVMIMMTIRMINRLYKGLIQFKDVWEEINALAEILYVEPDVTGDGESASQDTHGKHQTIPHQSVKA